MNVEIWFRESALPIERHNIRTSYIKGPFYCIVQQDSGVVEKFPVINIYKVKEWG